MYIFTMNVVKFINKCEIPKVCIIRYTYTYTMTALNVY